MPDSPAREANLAGGDNRPTADEGANDKYTPVMFTAASFPNTTGTLAKEFAKQLLETQRHAADQLFHFLWSSDNRDLLRLNMGQALLTALVAIPATNMVKLVFGMGVGLAGIGKVNQLANRLLMLHGEGDDIIGLPDILALHTDVCNKTEVNVPTDDEIQLALSSKGPTFGRFLIPPRNVDTTEEVIKIAPIPAYMILDGFNGDINAANVYERVLQSDHESPMMDHVKRFLKAHLVGPLRNEDEKPYVTHDEWNQMAPVETKVWRKGKLEALFPHIFNKTVNVPLAPQQQGQQGDLSNMFQAFFNEWRKAQNGLSRQMQEEKKDDDSKTLKASEFEKAIMKTLCGLPKDADDSLLPMWYLSLFNKHQDDKDRDHIVADVLNGTLRFEDAEIAVYPELKKVILKRNWVGGEAGGSPKFAYACYGLTPFAMLDLTEDQISQMEFDQQFLTDSSTVTPSDLRASKQKLVAKVPREGSKWKDMLLRFTNLLFVLFKGECPLYIKMLDIAKALRKYPAEVVDALPMHAKASVL